MVKINVFPYIMTYLIANISSPYLPVNLFYVYIRWKTSDYVKINYICVKYRYTNVADETFYPLCELDSICLLDKLLNRKKSHIQQHF